MKMFHIFGLALVCMAAFNAVFAASAAGQNNARPEQTKRPATAETIEELRADFRKLEFGMFIHYNMATYTGEQWVTGYPNPSTFNPGRVIDTDAWADAAQSAGMKYAVLTAKHVAGFCLWDSKYTTYDVMHPDCSYQKDLVAQFVKSFTDRGLKVGLYYHWRHPGFGDPNKNKVLPPECDPAKHSFEEQVAFQHQQIVELLRRYPDAFYMWNDGYDPEVGTAQEILEIQRQARPGILMASNWWDWGRKGQKFLDISIKELRHFPEGHTTTGETCWKMERGWFWFEGTSTDKTDDLLNQIAIAHARNSNFLLNVGPDKEGKLVESSVEALAEIGIRRKDSTK